MTKWFARLCSLAITTIVVFGCRTGSSTPVEKLDVPTPIIQSEAKTETIAVSTKTPTFTITQSPTPTTTSTTLTQTQLPKITLTPSPKATETSPPTLESEAAKEAVDQMLWNSLECQAPCFLGITPNQTTLNEADRLLSHLQVALHPTDKPSIYYFRLWLENGLAFDVNLSVQNEIVESIRVKIDFSQYTIKSIPREWSAFSPETLNDLYGVPSRVDFYLDYYPDTPTYNQYIITVYFETANIIIQYGGGDFSSATSLHACPLIDTFENVFIWFGEEPLHPPVYGIPLDDATELTLEEFSEMMNGDPKNACFNLNAAAFP